MGLVPIDKSVDELISRKAREQNKSKADILRDILEGRAAGGEGAPALDPESLAKALAAIPSGRPGTLAEEMKEMASSMMTIKMMQMMGQPTQQAPAPQHDAMDSIQRIFLLKELSKPSMYEMMMMQKMDRGEEPSAALKALAEGEKETRELLKGLLEDKKEAARQGEIDKLAGAMLATTESMKENYNKILDYMSKGEGAPKDTIEGYIANALKEQLTNKALDAIDKGLFQQESIVNPDTGTFNWKETLNRLMNMGEEWIKKMPVRTPPVQLVRRMDGSFVNPATGQAYTAEQASQIMQAATANLPQPIHTTPPPPSAEPQPPPSTAASGEQSSLKKKANDVINQFASQDSTGEEAQQSEQQNSEQPGGELY